MPILNEDAAEYGRLEPEHKKAWQTAHRLESQIRAHLEEKTKNGVLPDLEKVIVKTMKSFENHIVTDLQKGRADSSLENPENLYELVGAKRLAASNKLSRLVATNLGSAWEQLAALSHKALSPEQEFGDRIAGVDIVILDGGHLRHTQIKTQRNTLTGSQKNRSVAELRMYSYPLFAAAFDVASWTFSSKEIERIAGHAFWEMLGIPYSFVVSSARDCLLNIEKRVLDD